MSWTPLHSQLDRLLRRRRLLPREDAVLIAVSGGQDSLCLLQLLADLQPRWGWRLGVAHCDHGWPGDEGMAAQVETSTQGLDLPFYLAKTENLPQTEAEARRWRYQALADIAQSQGFNRVVTGHTQSDRAETLLYHLLRGSGSDGLQSLGWRRSLTPEIELVRPLLEISRAQTAAFCQDRGLPVWDDPYNQDRRFARNRLRLDLFPYLRKHFNPQVDQTLAQTLTILEGEADYWRTVTTRLYLQMAEPGPPPRLQRRLLGEQPLALQRRLIRHFLQLHLPQTPNFEQIEAVVALIDAPNGSTSTALPGAQAIQVQNPYLVLMSLRSLPL